MTLSVIPLLLVLAMPQTISTELSQPGPTDMCWDMMVDTKQDGCDSLLDQCYIQTYNDNLVPQDYCCMCRNIWYDQTMILKWQSCCKVSEDSELLAWFLTLYQEHPWVVYWALVALGIGALSLFCACFSDEKMTCTYGCRVFLFGMACALPCISIPICCCYGCFCAKEKCSLCGEEVKLTSISSHRPSCKTSLETVFSSLPDSPLYHCLKCEEPLKLWPKDHLEKADCQKCKATIDNSGENLHLCFICDKALCVGHNQGASSRASVEWDNLEALSEGGPGDQRGPGDLEAADPLLEPTFAVTEPGPEETTSGGKSGDPSAPPGANRPYTQPPENPAFTPYTPSNYTPYTPAASSDTPYTPTPYTPAPYTPYSSMQGDTAFPELPPSYEMAMIDETK